jgi:probable phosphoglycerate mutase
MIRILLIRHGSTDFLGKMLYGRMPGILLNSEGLRQAERLAEVLNSRYKIAEVLSSPLDRARQTAQPIATSCGLAVDIDEEITEIDIGQWMGKSFEELNQLADWKAYNRHRSIMQAPGGESMMHVQARAWRALDRLAQRHSALQGSTAAVITHGDVIRCILLLLLGMSIDHIGRIEIAPASVSEIVLGRDGPVVHTMNERIY